MLICRRSDEHEYHWNRLVILAIILISNVNNHNTVASFRMNLMQSDSWSHYETDCNTYGTCAKCATKASTCRWLLSEQMCVGLSSIVNTVKSCPTFRAVTKDGGSGDGPETCEQCVTESPSNSWLIEKQTCVDSSLVVSAGESCPVFDVGVGQSSVHVSIVNRVESFDEVLRNGIHCDLDGKRVNATRANYHHHHYSCDMAENTTADDEGPRRSDRLCVNYLSLMIDGDTPLKFDNPRDHYFTSFDRRCPVRCVTGFWETESDEYYCKWCLKKKECARSDECAVGWPCHVRRVRNATTAPYDPMTTIDVLSPEIKIVSVSPAVAPSSAGPTTVRITVRHHLFLADNRRVEIVAAGRPCAIADVRTRMSNETVIRCTVTPAGARYENRGPVVITYGGRRPGFRLTSAHVFRFITPVVHGLAGPQCGPVMGGTLLHIRGAYLNATDDVRVLIDGNRTCPIVAHDGGRISCVVGAARAPGSSRVRVTFDGRPPLRVGSRLSYEYVADPAIDEGQTFESIASGGTTLMVRGRFSCIGKWRMYVTYGGEQSLGPACKYLNKKCMICTSPRIRGTGGPAPPPPVGHSPLHGFVSAAGQRALNLTAINTSYVIHPDPVFEDFEINENMLTIYGRFLNRGYRKADLAIRVQGSADTLLIMNVRAETVDCWVPSALDVPAIVVKIGGCQEQVLQIKFNPGKFILSSMSSVFRGFIILTACVTFLSLLTFVLQTTEDSSQLRTEKRYVKLFRVIGARIKGER